VRRRSGGTYGTSVAPVGGDQEQWAKEDFSPRRETTSDSLRTDAARLRIV